jgi:hypothetical protein
MSLQRQAEEFVHFSVAHHRWVALVRLFLSWSKPQSRLLAVKLHQWIPEVVQRVSPWMSSEDIDKGQAWMAEITAQLDTTHQGLICVTRENYREPWLNFEAGALAKSMPTSRVRPILFGLAPADLSGPLAQFQVTVASDKDDMLRLMESLNAACEEVLDQARLERTFERTWGEFSAAVEEIERNRPPAAGGEQRTAEDKVDEILERIRGIDRRAAKNAYRSRSETPVYSIVSIDLADLGGQRVVVQKAVDQTTTVGDFLDDLYLSVADEVPAYTYGEVWALVDLDTSTLLRNLGSSWTRLNGRTRDERTLAEAGILPDARLKAVLLPGPE